MRVKIYVLIGIIWVLIPSYSILILPSLYFSSNESFALSPVVVVLSVLFSWLWWAFMVPRWRVWAYRLTNDVDELNKLALRIRLIWPRGGWFYKTEIKTQAIASEEKEYNDIEDMFKPFEDMKKILKNLPATNYYIFTAEEDESCVILPETPSGFEAESPWTTGDTLKPELKRPFVYEVEYYSEGNGELLDFYPNSTVPVMSKKLIAALKEAGVDNIQTFDVDINFLRTEKSVQTHQVVNILGNLKSCKTGVTERDFDNGSWIKKTGIDENALNGALFFRMIESPKTILMHVSLKKKLEKEFSGLSYAHPLECVI